MISLMYLLVGKMTLFNWWLSRSESVFLASVHIVLLTFIGCPFFPPILRCLLMERIGGRSFCDLQERRHGDVDGARSVSKTISHTNLKP